MHILGKSSDLCRTAHRRRHRLAALLVGAVLLFGLTRPASADPVTAVFDVSVFQRWDYGQQAIQPFSSSFQLTLQFDKSSTLFASADRALREYGPPTFSPVPSEFVVASRPAGIETIVRRDVTDQWWRSDEVYHRNSLAAIRETDPSFGNAYFSGLILSQPSVRGLAAPPELTTASFLQHLGAGNTINFLYTGYAVSDTGTARIFAPNSYQYQGIASLIRYDIPGGEEPPNPVPEPATVLLLGSGLAGLVYRRRRSLP